MQELNAQENWDAVVIGGGPAGLMAAQELSAAGFSVLVTDAKPSFARKFLMAGKSGLNLTKDEPTDLLLTQYHEAYDWLAPMIGAFDAHAITNWAEALGQQMFTGSTGRVFPTVMKASPLLRAWLRRLSAQGVEMRTLWRWTGWEGGKLCFDTPAGKVRISGRATVLALGGASWSRLGSDGAWGSLLQAEGVTCAPFAPSNVGIRVGWSDHMQAHFGAPIKGVAFHAGAHVSRGEAVISQNGIEGGGIYSLSRWIRDGESLRIDLMPDVSRAEGLKRLNRPRGKASLTNHLRKTLALGPVRLALLQEFGRPLPAVSADLIDRIKSLPVPHQGLAPMDQAISTAGGIARDQVTDGLMLKVRAGVFCAGEMLDWDAPTGGYLLTACLATGRWAGQNAARWLTV